MSILDLFCIQVDSGFGRVYLVHVQFILSMIHYSSDVNVRWGLIGSGHNQVVLLRVSDHSGKIQIALFVRYGSGQFR